MKSTIRICCLLVGLILTLASGVWGYEFVNLTQTVGRGFGSIDNRYAWSSGVLQGQLYVGTWNVQVDYLTLLQALINGSFDPNNPLAGTGLLRSRGGEIWRYDGGYHWTQVYKAVPEDMGFRSMFTWNNTLYTAAANYQTGAKILCSTNGTTWHQLAGGPIANPYNVSIRTFAQYNNALIIGTENNTQGAEVWAYANGSWTQLGGSLPDPAVGSLLVHQGKLYAGSWDFSDRFALFAYDAANNTWNDITPVFPNAANLTNLGVMKLVNFQNQMYLTTVNYRDGFTMLRSATPDQPDSWEVITTNGLGCKDNAYGWDAVEFQGKLWLGTFNSGLYGGIYAPLPLPLDGRAQLWESADGLHWHLVNGDGFGSRFTYGFRTLTVANDRLFLGTASNFLIPALGELDAELLALAAAKLGLDPGQLAALLQELQKLQCSPGPWIGCEVYAIAVPLPGTIMLLASGLLPLLLAGRRQRRKS